MCIYLKPGDKIPIPLTKTKGIKWNKSLIVSHCLKVKQNYVVVVDISPQDYSVTLAESNYGYGETFSLNDLTCKSHDKLTDLKLLKGLWEISKEINEKEKMKQERYFPNKGIVPNTNFLNEPKHIFNPKLGDENKKKDI